MARGAGYAAFLGAALIAVAVIIGIVLLQIGDQNDDGPAAAGTKKPTTKTTPTTKPKTTKTTPGTSATTAPRRTPNQVHLVVLNGGAASGQAAHIGSGLRIRGYTQQDPANTWTGHHQTGNTVYCRAGLEREATALAAQVSNAKLVLPYPSPAPPFSAGTDCVVVVGG